MRWGWRAGLVALGWVGVSILASAPAQAQVLPSVSGVPCTTVGTRTHCVGLNPDRVYIDFTYDSASGNSTSFTASPDTGRTTTGYARTDANGTQYLWVIDSELGVMDIYSGWLSDFYPVGNPYSAAFHDPAQYLMDQWPGGGDDGPPTPCGLHYCPLEP